MKREKQLTKRERKALKGPSPGHQHQHQHIHCVACGRHLDEAEFDPPATAVLLRCAHSTQWPSCTGCVQRARELLATHDRTNQPVAAAEAWH